MPHIPILLKHNAIKYQVDGTFQTAHKWSYARRIKIDSSLLEKKERKSEAYCPELFNPHFDPFKLKDSSV